MGHSACAVSMDEEKSFEMACRFAAMVIAPLFCLIAFFCKIQAISLSDVVMLIDGGANAYCYGKNYMW